MTFSIGRIVLAIVVAVVVGIVLTALLGPILVSVKVPIAVVVGNFFVDWGFIIGVLAGLWFYFSGATFGGVS